MARGGNTVPSITNAEHIGPQDTGDNIEAKRVANYVWDGSEWVRQSSSSSGGGSSEIDYSVNDIEEGTTSYYGKSNASGAFLVLKVTDTSVSYATVTNNGGVASYTDAWANRATLTYGRKDQAF